MKIPSLFYLQSKDARCLFVVFCQISFAFCQPNDKLFFNRYNVLVYDKGLYDKGEPQEKEQRCNGAIFFCKNYGSRTLETHKYYLYLKLSFIF